MTLNLCVDKCGVYVCGGVFVCVCLCVCLCVCVCVCVLGGVFACMLPCVCMWCVFACILACVVCVLCLCVWVCARTCILACVVCLYEFACVVGKRVREYVSMTTSLGMWALGFLFFPTFFFLQRLSNYMNALSPCSFYSLLVNTVM